MKKRRIFNPMKPAKTFSKKHLKVIDANIESVLWGVKDNDEDWQEVVLSTNPQAFERIKKQATKDGFGRFRIGSIDLTEKPDFTKTINRR